MNQMLIDDILSMKILDDSFGKRITDFCYRFTIYAKIDNAFSRREPLAVTKSVPF